MGKKQRNRLTQKKNNHVPAEDITAAEEAHQKENSAKERKNSH